MSNQMNEDFAYSDEADITLFDVEHDSSPKNFEFATGNGSQHLSVTPSLHYSTNFTNTVDRICPNEFDTAPHLENAAPIGGPSCATPYHADGDALRPYDEGASILQSPARDGTLDVTLYSGYPQYIDPSYLLGNQLGERDPQGQHMRGYEWHSTPENNASTGVLSSSNVNSVTSWDYQTNHPNLSAIASNQGPPMAQGFPALLAPPALSTCDWLSCNTTHPSSSMLAHWISAHLDPISTVMKQQPPGQKQAFCLWDYCHKKFSRRADLDRHFRSIHLGTISHCTVSGCDNNGGYGFRRPDKLKAHGKNAHGLL
ncbi:hypothetical protein BKA61DRAFT_681389 [Leptodontidium sp. MPI-SDFR-AT-0119]|nr:hypothetical protein BKA61DRAFT_681389 [Leptodontidium sp. MPI-SDFR-AT-0119]